MTNGPVRPVDPLAALSRLIDHAHGDNGGAQRIRRFLLGLYNGATFPFDLTDLRMLDDGNQRDVLAVLATDVLGRVEVHHWLPGKSDVIAAWADEAWPRDRCSGCGHAR